MLRVGWPASGSGSGQYSDLAKVMVNDSGRNGQVAREGSPNAEALAGQLRDRCALFSTGYQPGRV